MRWALVFVPLVLFLGMVSSLAGSPDSLWFQQLVKPATFPPPATFGIVWTVLYILMGLAAALIAAARGASGRGLALVLFLVQLLLNLCWSPVFFGMHRMTEALYVLVGLDLAVLACTAAFWRVRSRAALLMLPYLAWIAFATLLNWQFIEANPDADGRPTANAVTRIQLGP